VSTASSRSPWATAAIPFIAQIVELGFPVDASKCTRVLAGDIVLTFENDTTCPVRMHDDAVANIDPCAAERLGWDGDLVESVNDHVGRNHSHPTPSPSRSNFCSKPG